MRFFLFILFPLFALADSAKCPLDLVILGKETKQNFAQSGLVYLKETRLKGNAEIFGRLFASKIETDTALFVGSIELSQSHFHHLITVIGDLEAKKSTFDEPLTWMGQSAKFKECKIHSITVYPCKGATTLPCLELGKGCVVEGSIRFEDTNGELILFSDAVVKGSILASKITRR